VDNPTLTLPTREGKEYIGQQLKTIKDNFHFRPKNPKSPQKIPKANYITAVMPKIVVKEVEKGNCERSGMCKNNCKKS
jgi:hypothetical protein